MLEQNYIQKRVLNNAMKDRNIGKVLGLKQKQIAVLDVITKQGIKTDINKLSEYKRKIFVKAVKEKIGIGYETRKAFESVYCSKPQETKPKPNSIYSKPKVNAADELQAKKNRYDEIVNKGKGIENNLPRNEMKMPNSKVLNFSISNKGIRKVSGMLAHADENPKADLMDRLKEIQSKSELES